MLMLGNRPALQLAYVERLIGKAEMIYNQATTIPELEECQHLYQMALVFQSENGMETTTTRTNMNAINSAVRIIIEAMPVAEVEAYMRHKSWLITGMEKNVLPMSSIIDLPLARLNLAIAKSVMSSKKSENKTSKNSPQDTPEKSTKRKNSESVSDHGRDPNPKTSTTSTHANMFHCSASVPPQPATSEKRSTAYARRFGMTRQGEN